MKNNRKQINVSNNIGKIGLEENNYIYAEATDVMGNLVYKTEQERFHAFLLREKAKETLNPYDE